jgi:hypothetical protein
MRFFLHEALATPTEDELAVELWPLFDPPPIGLVSPE